MSEVDPGDRTARDYARATAKAVGIDPVAIDAHMDQVEARNRPDPVTAPTPGTRADSDRLAELLPCLLGGAVDDALRCGTCVLCSRVPAVRAWHDAQVADLTARAETAEAKVAAIRVVSATVRESNGQQFYLVPVAALDGEATP